MKIHKEYNIFNFFLVITKIIIRKKYDEKYIKYKYIDEIICIFLN